MHLIRGVLLTKYDIVVDSKIIVTTEAIHTNMLLDRYWDIIIVYDVKKMLKLLGLN